MKRKRAQEAFLEKLRQTVQSLKRMKPGEVHVFSINASYGHYQIVIGPEQRGKERQDHKRPIEINGEIHPVRIITKDSQSNPNRAAEVASQLILEEEVDLMLASSTADTTNPVADQCELNGVPCISTDTPWDGHFFGRGGDPAKGFTWTYHFFWGASQIVDSYTSLWGQLETNKKVGLLSLLSCPPQLNRIQGL